MTSREWLIHAGQVNMSDLDDVNTYDPNFGRGLTSATQLDLDLSSAFKTVVQMLNAGTLGYYLQDAYNKIEPYQYGGSLIGMLDSEGIDYEYSHIYARTEAATGAIRISSIAGGFLTTLAELRRTDEASALYWLGEQFDGSIWNGLEIFETVLKVALVAALLAATGGTAGGAIATAGSALGIAVSVGQAGLAVYQKFISGEISWGQFVFELTLSGVGIGGAGLGFLSELKLVAAAGSEARVTGLIARLQGISISASETRAGGFAIAAADEEDYRGLINAIMEIYSVDRQVAQSIVDAYLANNAQLQADAIRYRLPVHREVGISVPTLAPIAGESDEDFRQRRYREWLRVNGGQYLATYSMDEDYVNKFWRNNPGLGYEGTQRPPTDIGDNDLWLRSQSHEDFDGDGTLNIADTDVDGDGVLNVNDSDPFDSRKS